MRRTRFGIALLAGALLALATAPAGAVVPLAASYDARITGVVSEWNSFIPGYQVTGNVDLPALVFVEQRRFGPRPDAPVIGIFTNQLTALDTRPGAINFGTNSQAFRVIASARTVTAAAIDAAVVQANVAAGTVVATVEELSARSVQLNMFRTSAAFASAPAQILAGTVNLQFSADGRTFTGSFDLGGNGLIEPGNPLFRVRRYTANVVGTAQGAVVLPGAGGVQGDADGGGGSGGDDDAAGLRRLRAPRGGLRGLRRRGARVVLACPAACRATARLVASKRLARRAGLRRRVVGKASESRDDAGRLTLRLRLSKAAAARLAGQRRVRLAARVTVSGERIERSSFRRTLRVR